MKKNKLFLMTAVAAILFFAVLVAGCDMFGTANSVAVTPTGPNAYGIPVVWDGVAVNLAHVATIKAAVDWIANTGGPKQAAWVKAGNVKEFRVISGSGPTTVAMENGKSVCRISVGAFGANPATAVSEIGGALYDYAVSQGITGLQW
jgi:hypothetical protein